MRILLALITVFAVFQAQAYCYIVGNNNTPIKLSTPVEINLDVTDKEVVKQLDLSGMPDFICYVISNNFSLTTSEGTKEYHYSIKTGTHNLVLAISLEGEKTTSSSFTGGLESIGKTYPASALNSELRYRLRYSIKVNHTGSTLKTIGINDAVPLENKLIIKPTACSFLCNSENPNKNHKYIYEIPFLVKFTPTTCTFKNQEITVSSISYHEIDSNAFSAPTTDRPKIECRSTTGVATSNIHYHFEPVSPLNGRVLHNELGTQQGSAGDVGFELKNNGQIITFQPDQKFTLASRGSELKNNTIYPLDLQLRYARYGNKVFAGKVQSRVKVVVDYD